MDPDCAIAMRTIKGMKFAATMKEQAGELFKANDLDAAIKKFDECLEIDPLNLQYNATISLNKAIALTK